MRILVVAAHDAVNLSVENVIREFVRRGHELHIFAKLMEHRHLRMFSDLAVPIRPISELNQNEVEKCDIAFCPMDGVNALAFYDIYIFSYNFILSNRWASDGGDFMFVQTENRPIIQWEDCARMAVGTPKNDRQIKAEKKGDEKTILFVDTGHYPFGLTGKQQVAKTLLAICSNFPDHKIVVKPRWLPNEKNTCHTSRIHLYNILSELCNGDLPSNLELLYEHRDMQELIDNSMTVVTPGSSAFLDAALRGKNILILNGFTSENSFELRTDTMWKQQFTDMAESGCLVDYRDALQFLPYGLRCKEEYLNKKAAYRGNVSEKVVDVIEYIQSEILSKKRLPKIASYHLSNYKAEIQSDDGLDFSVLQKKRMKNQILKMSRRFDWVAADIDYSPWLDLLNLCYKEYSASRDGLQSLQVKMEKKLYELWANEGEKMARDPIDQSFFLQSLNNTGKADKILEIPKHLILCEGPYHYYLGLIYSKRNQPSLAIEHYVKFIIDASRRSCFMYPQDSWGFRNAYNYVFSHCDKENITPLDFAEIYSALYDQRDVNLIEYRARKRAHNLLPKTAEQILDTDWDLSLKCYQLYAKYEYHYNIRERDNKIRALTQDINSLRSAKLYRLKEGIKWFFRKLKDGIRCLREHGFRYTVQRAAEKGRSFFESQTKNSTPFKIYAKFREVRYGFSVYARLAASRPGQYLYVAPFGTGDIYIIGRFYRPFLKYMGWGNRELPALIVAGGTAKTVSAMYDLPEVETVTREESMALIWLWMNFGNGILNGRVLHWGLAMNHLSIIRNMEGLHGFNMYSFYKYAVFQGIDEERLSYAAPKGIDMAQYMAENGLIPGKTVLLVPHSPSAPWRPPEDFWINLAGALTEKGYSMCTNTGGPKEVAIPGTAAVSLPIEQMIPFLNMAGNMISVRTGFADVTESATCKRIVFYPKIKNIWSQIASYHDTFSINGMYGKDSDIEIEYEPKNPKEMISQILDQFD